MTISFKAPMMYVQCLIAAAMLLYGAQAKASGCCGPDEEFISLGGTDVNWKDYGRGELGVVLSSYPRVYLYPAWRAFVLGKTHEKIQSSNTENLARSLNGDIRDWVDSKDVKNPRVRWLMASQPSLSLKESSKGSKQIAVWGTVSNGNYEASFVNCPDGAFAFAVDTLTALQARSDSTAPRLAAWIDAQNEVFNRCSSDKKPWQVLAALSRDEPLYWQQLRQYQMASQLFYSQNFDQSERLFRTIGKTPNHPMQVWGEYLALRSQIRRITLDPSWDQAKSALSSELSNQLKGDPLRSEKWNKAMAAFDAKNQQWNQKQLENLVVQAQLILNNAQLDKAHEPVRATIRSLQFRLVPEKRLYELSDFLNNPLNDPYQTDALGDWRRLMNDWLQANEDALRTKYEYIDWMRSLQRCALNEFYSDAGNSKNCEIEAGHAIRKWKLSPVANGANALNTKAAWLVAALSLSRLLPPDLEQAALAVKPSSAEYLTVQFHLARLYRISNDGVKADKARMLLDGILQSEELKRTHSISAMNLFRQERFALANTMDDAVKYSSRDMYRIVDPDTQTSVVRQTKKVEKREQFSSDARDWLQAGLTAKELLELSSYPVYGQSMQINLAVAAWIRADLLSDAALADRAAKRMAELDDSLKAISLAYQGAVDQDAKRHIMVVTSLKHGLSPTYFVNHVNTRTAQRSTAAQPDVVASMWCAISGNDSEVARLPEWLNPSSMPLVSAKNLERDTEIKKLNQLGTATGFVGRHVLAYAKQLPDDPDVPWLLYVVVHSTRGGCLDADNSEISKAAFQLMHKRYSKSSWAKKTGFWY